MSTTLNNVYHRIDNLGDLTSLIPGEDGLLTHEQYEENPIIDNYQYTDFLLFWQNCKRDFSDGEYRITYSKYGIEGVNEIRPINREYDEETNENGNEGEPEREIDEAELEAELAELEKEPNINCEESFKSDSCVVCLDEKKKPNILFCNCGHLCLCEECNELYKRSKCPVCKTENTIKRKILKKLKILKIEK